MKLTMDNFCKEKVDPEKVWNLLLDFAKYGFNKSHSISYSLISYSTAYAWVHYFKDFVEYNLNKHLKKRTAMMDVLQNKLGYKLHEIDYHKKYKVTDRYMIDEKTKTIYPPIPHEFGFNNFTEILRMEDKSMMQKIILMGVLDNLSYPDLCSADRQGMIELFSYDIFPNTFEDTDDWNKFINSLDGMGGFMHCTCKRDRERDVSEADWLEYEEPMFSFRDIITKERNAYNMPTKICKYYKKKVIPESSIYHFNFIKPRMRNEKNIEIGNYDKEFNDKYDVKFKGSIPVVSTSLDNFMPDRINIIFEKWDDKLMFALFKRFQMLIDKGKSFWDADEAVRKAWHDGVIEQVPLDSLVNKHFSYPIKCEYMGLTQNTVTLKFNEITRKFYGIEKDILERFALKKRGEICHVLIHPKWSISQKGETDRYNWIANYVIVGVV